ncbi:MAG: hypothetical protein ABH952_01550 [Candidatus Omnitrophota bacterium]
MKKISLVLLFVFVFIPLVAQAQGVFFSIDHVQPLIPPYDTKNINPIPRENLLIMITRAEHSEIAGYLNAILPKIEELALKLEPDLTHCP